MNESPDKEQEHRDEAERLTLLPADEQRKIIAMHREIANAKGVPKKERQAGLERADALERLLAISTKKRKRKS